MRNYTQPPRQPHINFLSVNRSHETELTPGQSLTRATWLQCKRSISSTHFLVQARVSEHQINAVLAVYSAMVVTYLATNISPNIGTNICNSIRTGTVPIFCIIISL